MNVLAFETCWAKNKTSDISWSILFNYLFIRNLSIIISNCNRRDWGKLRTRQKFSLTYTYLWSQSSARDFESGEMDKRAGVATEWFQKERKKEDLCNTRWTNDKTGQVSTPFPVYVSTCWKHRWNTPASYWLVPYPQTTVPCIIDHLLRGFTGATFSLATHSWQPTYLVIGLESCVRFR